VNRLAGLATAPIDPVASPDAYRRELLSWLGDDDFAVVQLSTARNAADAILAQIRPRSFVRPTDGQQS
jgi:hypothetical protein